jgi:hypothetical protein
VATNGAIHASPKYGHPTHANPTPVHRTNQHRRSVAHSTSDRSRLAGSNDIGTQGRNTRSPYIHTIPKPMRDYSPKREVQER